VLRSKLSLAERNAPMERQALLLANKVIRTKRADNPGLTPKALKKIRGQVLQESRLRMNAKKPSIEISDREWDAIQAGAISNNMLVRILENTNLKSLKQRATPRSSKILTPAKLARARSLAELGNTQSEIAAVLGVSVSTLSNNLK